MFLGAHQPAVWLWFNFSSPFPGLQLFILRMAWDGLPLLSQYLWLPDSFLSVLDMVTLTQSCVFLSRFLTLWCLCLVFSWCTHYFPSWFSSFILFHLLIFSHATFLSLLFSFFFFSNTGSHSVNLCRIQIHISILSLLMVGLMGVSHHTQLKCRYFLRENFWRDQIPSITIELVVSVDLVIAISGSIMWEIGS